MAGRVDKRLEEQGLVLPEAAAPAANYVPFVVSGGYVYISGQLPMVDGKPGFLGKLGADVELEQGVEAARTCAVNILAQLRAAAGGDFDRVARCVKLGGYVNSTPEFTQQPAVVNGASNLMVDVLGDAGRHARFAVGVNALPFGVAVEVEALFALG